MKSSLWFKVIVIVLLIIIILILFFRCCCGGHGKTSWHEYEKLDSTKKEDTSQMVVWRQPGVTDQEMTDFLNHVQDLSSRDITIFRYCKNCDNSLFLIDGAENFLEIIDAQGQTASGGTQKIQPGAQGNVGGIFYSANIAMSSVDTLQKCDSVESIPVKPQVGVREKYNDNSSSNKLRRLTTSIKKLQLKRPQLTPNQTSDSISPNEPQPQADTVTYNPCDTIPPIFSDDNRDSVIVAVFDTGVDTVGGIGKYMYTSSKPSCINGGENGWNFAGDNSDWRDDNVDEYHGTIVTRQIINEVYSTQGNYGVRILPVKLLDKDGHCFLFDLFCAIKYAEERGAQVINASLGYYTYYQDKNTNEITAPADNAFLKAYVESELTRHNIVLVCAAGNQFNNDYYTRNLDEISFMPASLSKDVKNVIAVTTVNETLNTSSMLPGSSSPVQNYSRNIVDVGVQCEFDHYLFENPLGAGGTLNGSSFATPLITASLCMHYDIIKNVISTQNWTKDDMMKNLLNARVYGLSSSGLDTATVDGKYFLK